MKYKTFRAIAITGGLALAAGGVVLVARSCAHRAPTSRPAASRPATRPPATPAPTATASAPLAAAVPAGGTPLSTLDRRVLELLQRGVTAKQKDAVPGNAKVNLYPPEHAGGEARAKIDLDRDGNWDEKWTASAAGEVTRDVSSSDDGKTYDRRTVLQGGGWVTPGAAPAAAPEAPPAAAAEGPGALRPVDEEVLALLQRPIAGSKVKDALPGRPYKVNLYRDAGHAGVNRLKIDLDRDGKWDEKWDLERAGAKLTVKRHVAPNDDERYSDEYRLRAGRWVQK